MAKKDEAKGEAEQAVVETPDSPLLDLSDAAVKRMLKIAKKRGWVTQEELNAVLPSEEISSDQIEDMNAMLSEMGINVVESEDAEEADKESGETADEEEAGLDDDVVDHGEDDSRDGGDREEPQAHDHVADLADDREREHTSNVVLRDRTEDADDHGDSGDHEQQCCGPALVGEEKQLRANDGVDADLGEESGKHGRNG